MRGRAWRRAQTARFHARAFKRLLKRDSGSYHYEWCMQRNGVEYYRRNSIDETVIVYARTPDEYVEYLRLVASREMNNPKVCGCVWCRNVRRRGLGNSKETLTIAERSFRSYAVAEIDLTVEEYNPINYSWRHK